MSYDTLKADPARERIDVMLGLAKHFELAMGWQPDLSLRA